MGRSTILLLLALCQPAYGQSQTPAQGYLDQALIGAVRKGDTATVKQLLGRGASPNAHETKVTKPDLERNLPGGLNYPGDTALMLAIEGKFDNLAKLLVSKGANVNLAGEAGFTPLISAAQRRNAAMVSFLISKGAKPNVQNKHGDTAIVFAANMGDIPSVKALLDAKADINGGTGWTPLMQAAYQCHTELVKYLLERGADPNFHRPQYMSPLECAQAQGADDIAEILRKAGAKGKTAQQQKKEQDDVSARVRQELENARKAKAAKYAALGKLTETDRALIVAFIEDLSSYKGDVSWYGNRASSKVALIAETCGSISEYQDGQINSELDPAQAAQVTLDMRRHLMNRNFAPVSLADLRFSTPNVLMMKESDMPKGRSGFWGEAAPAKGWVQLYLPGLNADATRAVIRFHFGPTSHGAAGTYLLEHSGASWKVLWRRFAYYV